MIFVTETGFCICEFGNVSIIDFKHKVHFASQDDDRTIISTDGGLFERDHDSDEWSLIEFPHAILGLSSGTAHTIILSSDGLYVCGPNAHHHLESGNDLPAKIPIKLNLEPRVISVSCGMTSTIVHADDGVYVCGLDMCGQLGIDECTVTRLTRLPIDEQVISVATGGYHTIIQVSNGVYSCGYNNYGQLLLAPSDNIARLTKVEYPGILMIGCTEMATIIVMDDGIHVYGRLSKYRYNNNYICIDRKITHLICESYEIGIFIDDEFYWITSKLKMKRVDLGIPIIIPDTLFRFGRTKSARN